MQPQAPRSPSPDINQLLGAEQTAIMQADAAGESVIGTAYRERADRLGEELHGSSYPHRIPLRQLSRESIVPVSGSTADSALLLGDDELTSLQVRVNEMEAELGRLFAEGLIGRRHNTFAHKARLISQARQRLAGQLDAGSAIAGGA